MTAGGEWAGDPRDSRWIPTIPHFSPLAGHSRARDAFVNPQFQVCQGMRPGPVALSLGDARPRGAGRDGSAGRPDGQVRRTKVTNDNVASPTVPVISQQ